jgi:S-formylglutathione hydrolase
MRELKRSMPAGSRRSEVAPSRPISNAEPSQMGAGGILRLEEPSMVEIRATHRVHGGVLSYAQHQSASTGTQMRFSVFTPPGEGPFAYLIWLSGLTCTEDNFTTKAGAYGPAAQAGLAIVAPDTSPRGECVADDPGYDLGQGAGFYIDATQAPWAAHFKMESYVTRDLIEAVEGAFPLKPRRGIFGHSMGGHGALTLAMKHPSLFTSVSAFAPIASPTRCPWGEKAFLAHLGGVPAKGLLDTQRMQHLLNDDRSGFPFLHRSGARRAGRCPHIPKFRTSSKSPVCGTGRLYARVKPVG